MKHPLSTDELLYLFPDFNWRREGKRIDGYFHGGVRATKDENQRYAAGLGYYRAIRAVYLVIEYTPKRGELRAVFMGIEAGTNARKVLGAASRALKNVSEKSLNTVIRKAAKDADLDYGHRRKVMSVVKRLSKDTQQ